jgi:hypothetical protein
MLISPVPINPRVLGSGIVVKVAPLVKYNPLMK